MIYRRGINNSGYAVAPWVDGKRVLCPYYKTWEGMLRRVYCEASLIRQPTYRNASICLSWHWFSEFKAWMQTQDWKGKALDKDLLDWKNKHYSPKTCLFISGDVNNLLCLCPARRGEFPLGVCYHKASKKYLAQIVRYGKKSYLGLFTDITSAHEAYKRAKLEYIEELACLEPNQQIQDALRALH